MRPHGRLRRPCRAGGAALLLYLLFLAPISLLGFTAASDAYLQQRMAGNRWADARALGLADAAAAWAAAWLDGLDGTAPPTPCAPPCPDGTVIRVADAGDGRGHRDAGWWAANGQAYGADPGSGHRLAPPLAAGAAFWTIEELHIEAPVEAGGAAAEIGWYRITAFGAVPQGHAASVVEAIVARPWGDAAWSVPLPPRRSQPPLCAGPEVPAPCGRHAWRRLR